MLQISRFIPFSDLSLILINDGLIHLLKKWTTPLSTVLWVLHFFRNSWPIIFLFGALIVIRFVPDCGVWHEFQDKCVWFIKLDPSFNLLLFGLKITHQNTIYSLYWTLGNQKLLEKNLCADGVQFWPFFMASHSINIGFVIQYVFTITEYFFRSYEFKRTSAIVLLYVLNIFLNFIFLSVCMIWWNQFTLLHHQVISRDIFLQNKLPLFNNEDIFYLVPFTKYCLTETACYLF